MAPVVCAVCESIADEGGYPLYESTLCRSCWAAFTWRRAVAFIVDVAAAGATVVVLGRAIIGIAALYDEPARATMTGMAYLVAAGFAIVAFLLKDGLFDGRSPGKALLGVRVVDERTRRPIDPSRALVRTLPLLAPLVPVVAAVQMLRGPRLADGAMQTRVVWDAHPDREPFRARAHGVTPIRRTVPAAATTAPLDPWG
jgi:uncharacterized RDD family membrane protein YckC